MNNKILNKKSPIEKELDHIARREARLTKQAQQYQTARWKENLEQKIPPRVHTNLQTAFCKAFELIFEKGTGLIEKTYSRSEMELDFQVHDYAVGLKGGKKELRGLKTDIRRGNLVNMAVSAVEGVGLGALGIGLPDIALFLSVILKGTYETAVRYGFSYDTPREKLFILKMLEASMARGEQWAACNAEVDSFCPGRHMDGNEVPGTGQKDGRCVCTGYAPCQICAGNPCRGNPRRHQQSNLLQTDPGLCAVEISETLSAAKNK